MHFILAALAAIMPLKESSKQTHAEGGLPNAMAQLMNTCGFGFPNGKNSAEHLAEK